MEEQYTAVSTLSVASIILIYRNQDGKCDRKYAVQLQHHGTFVK